MVANRSVVDKLSRRRLLRLAAVAGGTTTVGVLLAACGETQIVERVVTREVPVEKIVEKEVPVEVERVVTREVEKVVTREVEVERVVTREVEVEVIKEVPAMRETVTVRWQEVWADVFQGVIEDKMIPGFEAEFPYIKIENERIEQAQMYEIYLTQIAGGDPPDVIMIQESRVPQFATRHGIIPLDAFIAKSGLDVPGTFYVGEWPKGQWLGVQYSLPLDNTGAWYLFWWDKDAFAEVGLDPDTPPANWTELEEMALQLTVGEGEDITRHGMFVPEMAAGRGTDRSFKAWHFPAGGDMFTEDAKTVLFDDDIGLRNVSWQFDMVQKINAGWDNVIGYMECDRGFPNRVLQRQPGDASRGRVVSRRHAPGCTRHQCRRDAPAVRRHQPKREAARDFGRRLVLWDARRRAEPGRRLGVVAVSHGGPGEPDFHGQPGATVVGAQVQR